MFSLNEAFFLLEVLESSDLSSLDLSPLLKKPYHEVCFSLILAGLACGLIKTMTEPSAQCGKVVWMEVVNKIMGRPQAD